MWTIKYDTEGVTVEFDDGCDVYAKKISYRDIVYYMIKNKAMKGVIEDETH